MCERAGWSKKTNKSTVAREPEQVFTSSCMAQPSEGTKHIHIKMKEQTEKTEGMRGGQQWQAEKKRKRHCGSHSFSFSSSLSPDKIPEGNAAW